MRKSKFTETQILSMIKEAESGIPVPEISINIALVKAHFTNGAQSMEAWKRLMLNASKNLKKKIVN